MTTTYGMITNYEDIKTIRTKGTACKIMIRRLDRDGYGYDTEEDGYEYDGHRYTIGTDRDGWPIAWEKA